MSLLSHLILSFLAMSSICVIVVGCDGCDCKIFRQQQQQSMTLTLDQVWLLKAAALTGLLKGWCLVIRF